MRDIKYDTVLRKCRENDAAEMYVANTIWPTDEGPVSGKAVAAALATKQPLITPEHKLPAELVEGGGGSAEWGGITGDIANQADLQGALADKLGVDAVGITVAGLVDGKVPAGNIPNLDYLPLSGGTLTGALNVASGGISQDITEIPSATSAYTLADGCYSHTPSMPPVYTLPDVSDATRTHAVSLKVVFSAGVLSCMFLDASGNEITPDGDPPAIGDGTVVDYLCEWEASKPAWTIMPLVVVEGDI